ncbi:hypothetical protein G4B88_005541 [Cannabis sativa]|uniref:Ubiquitin-like protease family profile domain-containing protein n=1 Tax=Cannabis sativa TaxID=3483 RepID=A0A7J6HA76_CANSA|nr:hypothetical protein G4B88_005541 [Cannabis sativa]
MVVLAWWHYHGFGASSRLSHFLSIEMEHIYSGLQRIYIFAIFIVDGEKLMGSLDIRERMEVTLTTCVITSIDTSLSDTVSHLIPLAVNNSPLSVAVNNSPLSLLRDISSGWNTLPEVIYQTSLSLTNNSRGVTIEEAIIKRSVTQRETRNISVLETRSKQSENTTLIGKLIALHQLKARLRASTSAKMGDSPERVEEVCKGLNVCTDGDWIRVACRIGGESGSWMGGSCVIEAGEKKLVDRILETLNRSVSKRCMTIRAVSKGNEVDLHPERNIPQLCGKNDIKAIRYGKQHKRSIKMLGLTFNNPSPISFATKTDHEKNRLMDGKRWVFRGRRHGWVHASQMIGTNNILIGKTTKISYIQEATCSSLESPNFKGKHDKDKVYLKGKDKIVPPFRFGVEDVATKMWFHKLAYPGQCLTNSHLDIIFYYLRKKGKYAKEPKVKFTTTDCLFFKTIHALYEKFIAQKKDLSLITAQHAIADYIRGRKMLCGYPWHLCDHVLFIIHMETESHWILGRLNIEERRMYMYNSLSTARKDSAAIKACQPFAVLLPHFFALFDEFKKENKPVCLDPFEVVKVDGLPQQTSNDCGCFVASFAEYFIDMKPIPPIFDVEKHRDRLAVLFYKYARMKEVDFIDSEDEAPPKGPKKNLS